MNNEVAICLYEGMARLASRSGVGVAMRHQEHLYELLGWRLEPSIRGDYQIAHLNTVFPDTPMVADLAKLRKRKVVVHAHSTEEDFRGSFKASHRVSGLFRRWIMTCYRKGDLVLTPTEYSKNLILGYGLDRPVEVISNGVDHQVFHPDEAAGARFRERYQLSADRKIVICVGLPIERKGVLDVIEVASRLPDVTFLWFGSINMRLLPQNIRDAIAKAPENLRFMGFVEPSLLREAYCGADLFLMATHEETEGIVMLEALASQTPILVRDIPIYESWLQEGTHVWKARDVDEFEQRIIAMLNNDLPRLTAAGAKVAAKRDLPQIAQKLADIYARHGLVDDSYLLQ